MALRVSHYISTKVNKSQHEITIDIVNGCEFALFNIVQLRVEKSIFCVDSEDTMTENEDKNLLTLSMLADGSRLKFSEHGGKYNRRYFSRKV